MDKTPLRPRDDQQTEEHDYNAHQVPPRSFSAKREQISIPEERSYLIRLDDYPYQLCIWNYHPEWELHYIPYASGLAYVGDYVGSFEPGHLVLCGKNLPHNWITPSGVVPERDYVLQFDADRLMAMPELRALQALAPMAERGIEFFGDDAARIGAMVMRLAESSPAAGLGIFAEIVGQLHAAQDSRLMASAGFVENYVPLSGRRHARIDEAIQMLQSSPSTNMQTIAKKLGTDPATFSRSFKALTGMNFSTYLCAVRLGRARAMLADTSQPITDICFDSGFSNLSNFNRTFLRETGMTPRTYRKIAHLKMSQGETGPKVA
ncbi:helix-turn-helix domain-containing protein [Paracoccus caeni]|uniref:Helix-turn-helix domain-containing protein n=1 Tax=Paracoccus caeni TaxID=657651 RepID=A0A934SG77_9RHOB|nr:helix-turn-helix domain-containing protein [Paracoccus caeni]MBK4216850.1 helix-turn-helix domain-containing protein [Paracoccus caeni]